MLKIIVCGVGGRMGSRIMNLVKKDNGLELIGAIEGKGHPDIGKDVSSGVKIEDDLERVIRKGDVVIDFTSPQATLSHLESARRQGKPIVIGTTGFSDKEMEPIKKASGEIPVLISPNMSIGVNLLFELVEKVAAQLEGYDIEIVEAHHNQKKDSPSGTAKKIAEIIAGAQKLDLGKAGIYGRKGLTGPRKKDEIGIHAVRAGDIVGDHTVLFAGRSERIELVHRAHTRDAFAWGAVKAAKWISGKPCGLYSMQDVLHKGENR